MHETETDNVVSLSTARAIAEDDASVWSAVDAAKQFIKDVESGKINPESVYISFWDKQETDTVYSYYCASPSKAETIYLLNVALAKALLESRQ